MLGTATPPGNKRRAHRFLARVFWLVLPRIRAVLTLEFNQKRAVSLMSGANQLLDTPLSKSLFENYEGCCGKGFWLWPKRRGPSRTGLRSIPASGCDGRANAGHSQKTCRPGGVRGEGRLASLLLGHRPLYWPVRLAPPSSRLAIQPSP